MQAVHSPATHWPGPVDVQAHYALAGRSYAAPPPQPTKAGPSRRPLSGVPRDPREQLLAGTYPPPLYRTPGSSPLPASPLALVFEPSPPPSVRQSPAWRATGLGAEPSGVAMQPSYPRSAPRDERTPSVRFTDLPNELILMVASYLPSICHLTVLQRTNRRLAAVLTPTVHRAALQPRGDLPVLFFAAKRGYAGLFALALGQTPCRCPAADAGNEHGACELHSRRVLEHGTPPGSEFAALGCTYVSPRLRARPAFGGALIHYVARSGNVEVMRLLIERAERDRPWLKRRLIKLPGDVGGGAGTPLQIAAAFERRALGDLLMDYDLDLDFEDKMGAPPVHCSFCWHAVPHYRLIASEPCSSLGSQPEWDPDVVVTHRHTVDCTPCNQLHRGRS
jgi:hypothetical protein